MNKIKKVITSTIIMLIVILGICNVSNAYYVGQKLSVSFSQYMNNSNIYCMERGQALKGTMTYKVISHVKIEGTKSTDHKGKTIDSKDNAKFAAILSGDNGSVKYEGKVANGVWNFGYTWMKNVGQYHAGLYKGFAGSRKGKYTSSLDTSSSNYANTIDAKQEITDNTDKNKIKATAYEKDGKQYMRIGPFNWTFSGNLTEIAVYDQDGKAISNKLYSNFSGKTEKWFAVGSIKSGKDFYISIPNDGTVSRITKITGKGEVKLKGVGIWFLEAQTGYFQNLLVREPYTMPVDIETSFDYKIDLLGHLKVIKVNENNEEVKLQGVGFYIQNKETGKYVKKSADGKITYVNKDKEPTEFVTDGNGEILIKNLVVGTYVAYETKNPNYGYEIIKDGIEKNIVVDKTTELQIGNKQIYVKLSGYVWLDKISGKQSTRNDLFKDNDYDSNDILLDGIPVRLKDKSGNVVNETTTSNGGAYQFTDVLVEKLSEYYIEFEYDGLTYTNVIPHNDKDNGSKSAENTNVRIEFNKNFSIVEGKTESTGITRDANGNEKHNLSYNIDQNAHTATLINNGQYIITANTNETGYSIEEHFTPGQEEIKYINLGLYEREQPDIAIMKDLENVNVVVNGYNHIYQYSQRYKNQGEYGDGFNVGVKFGNKYGTMSYTRAIYKADYEYINEQDKDKELKVYVTYKIAVRNESTNLLVRVNNLVDYFDGRYTVEAIGTSVNQDGTINGNIERDVTTYNNDYSKAIIHTNMVIEAQKQSDVYVQFKLNREAVLNILNDGENLENVVEINSYSIFDKQEKIYAGIDKDSNPGNVTPENKALYQDDTDSAPALKLEVADGREMTGKVFVDATSQELKTGEVRQGNGAYDNGENTIEGVKVTLTENTGSGKVYEAITNANGDFTITGFIPGDYTLTYTWGDQTYTVQDYKGTIYDSTRNQNDKQWYKKDVDNRLTDALDDYQLRLKIDEELKTIMNSTTTTIDKMNSTTPTMGIGVEYESTYTASLGDRYVYSIKNIDFGIVERARQSIELEKRVSSFRATLANGQIVTDAKIDENGNMTGQTQHLTNMGPVKLEMDSELMQGTTIEVGYEIKAINRSEIEYLSQNFYHYGKVEGEVITMTPTAIIDYLDKDWGFEQEKNPEWQVKQVDEVKGLLAEVVYNNPNSAINDKIILYTESLKSYNLKPTESAAVMLNVSKIISNSEDIELDNETELVRADKPGGPDLEETPGNYIPGLDDIEPDDDKAQTVIVTPNTGANRNFVSIILMIATACMILGAGIVIIKKKII